MKFERKFVLFMTVFMVVSFAYLFMKDTGSKSATMSQSAAEKNKDYISTQYYSPKTTGSMGQGDAVISLVPNMVDRNILEVNFSINTHSVNLSGFDLKRMAVLEHEEHVFKPVKASRVGGHHSSGVFVFDVGDKIGSKDSFRIRLQGIPKLLERIYEWDEV